MAILVDIRMCSVLIPGCENLCNDSAARLQELAGECGSQSLNPNELGAVLKVLSLLAAELETDTAIQLSTVGFSLRVGVTAVGSLGVSEWSESLAVPLKAKRLSPLLSVMPSLYRLIPPLRFGQDFYVPDERSELVPWGLCLHNDSPSLAGRVDRSKLRCLHPKVSLDDCRLLRIPSVSQARLTGRVGKTGH